MRNGKKGRGNAFSLLSVQGRNSFSSPFLHHNPLPPGSSSFLPLPFLPLPTLVIHVSMSRHHVNPISEEHHETNQRKRKKESGARNETRRIDRTEKKEKSHGKMIFSSKMTHFFRGELGESFSSGRGRDQRGRRRKSSYMH